MRNLTMAVLAAVLLGACTGPRTQPQQNISTPPPAVPASRDKPLFVHLLAPPIYSNTIPARATNSVPAPAQRIATAQVYLSQHFRVSVGRTDDPFTNRWEGAVTNARFDKNGTAEARPLEPIWNTGDAILAGRVEQRDGNFFAHLQGRHGTTLNYFHGQIELEKPVYHHGALYRDGAIWGVWFALSESSDCGRFLKELDDGTLHRPTVPADSPEAKQWEKRENVPPRK